MASLALVGTPFIRLRVLVGNLFLKKITLLSNPFYEYKSFKRTWKIVTQAPNINVRIVKRTMGCMCWRIMRKEVLIKQSFVIYLFALISGSH